MTNAMSKPLKEGIEKNTNNTNNINNIFTNNDDILKINDYFEKNIDLTKYKLYGLRPIAKYYKLKTTGNKSIIIDRIRTFFIQTKNSIIIQKWWRKSMVLMFFKLKGITLKDRHLCLNDTDFCTLEKIKNINNIDFFGYESLGKHYGCNLNSMIELLNHDTNPKNPYDRQNMSKNIIKNIVILNNIKSILFPMKKTNTSENFNIHNIDIPEEYSNSSLSYNYFRPRLYNKSILKERNMKDRYINLCKRRIKSVDQRITDIFYTYDEYGNYTNSIWFYQLSFTKLVAFYRCLYEIWSSRTSHIPTTEKKKICCLFDPFQSIFTGNVVYNQSEHDESIYTMRTACITIIENMLFTSIDEEYSKIGALHTLTAFTVVSLAARSSMPWLYESIR